MLHLSVCLHVVVLLSAFNFFTQILDTRGLKRLFFAQKPVGGVAVLPAGGLFGQKKKDDAKDKENNLQNNGDVDQLNSSNESESTPKDKRAKVSFFEQV